MADIPVNAGGSLQTAITNAAGGDTITLEAGGHFAYIENLPAKASLVTIRSSAWASMPNRRITPGDAALMPIIDPDPSNARYPTVGSDGGANWKLDGICISPTNNGWYTAAYIVHADNITFDRCLLVATDPYGQRRGIGGGGTNITVTRCHIAGIVSGRWDILGPDGCAYGECAAVGFWNGSGPYTITDNYLEAGGQNVFIGGALADSAADIPCDVLVEGNTLNKPEIWRNDPYKGVKNLFELKCAKRVIVRNNIMSGAWPSQQDGTAILFQPVDSGPWATIDDVLFELNTIDRIYQGISLLGYWWGGGGQGSTEQLKNIIFQDNEFTFSTPCYHGMTNVSGECGKLEFYRNTFTATGSGVPFCWLGEGSVWPTAEELPGPRTGHFAIEDLTFVGNTVTGWTSLWGADGLGGSNGTAIFDAPTNNGYQMVPTYLVAEGLCLSTGVLPDGIVNVPYSKTLAAAGGTAPYTFALTSGSLPTGLSLTGATISGTPTEVVVARSLTFTVTDAVEDTAPRTLTLTTTAAPNSETFWQLWQPGYGVIVDGGTITKYNNGTNDGTSLDSGAESAIRATATDWVELRIPSGYNGQVGLFDGVGFPCGIFFGSTGYYNLYDAINAAWLGEHAYTGTDLFRIERTAGVTMVKQNGVEVTPSQAWATSSSTYTVGALLREYGASVVVTAASFWAQASPVPTMFIRKRHRRR